MRRARFVRPAAWIAIASTAFVAACGWDPTKPFEREAPEVREAIGHLDGGDASAASDLLEEYLTTGACKEGSIGTPPRVKERANGSFDLGLGLFRIAERYGKRFGDEESEGAKTMVGPEKESRADNVACALRVVRAIAEDGASASGSGLPVELRARARYLEGNLLFLNGAYEDAVRAYDHALELAPGMPDGGIEAGPKTFASDPVGRDAAWNRAIALRRIEDKKKDAGKDGGDEKGDGGNNQDDKNDDKNKDAGNKGGDDAGKDSGSKPDAGQNDDKDKSEKPPQPSNDPPQPQPSSRQNQDERMLDQLENAPTVQQEAAKKGAQKRRARGGMADK